MIIGIEAARANQPNKTGTEWYAYELTRALVALGAPHEYILYSKTPLEPPLASLGPNVESRVLSWPPRLWTHTALLWEVNTSKPDVLFVPAHTIPFLHLVPTVTMTHDVGFRRAPELYAQKELAYHRFSMWLAAKTARMILVPSEFTKREILELYDIPERRLKVIYHGFDSGRFRVMEDAQEVQKTLDRYGIRRPYCLYVGRLQEKKNIPNLIRAFAEVRKKKPEVVLVLAGKPDYHFDRMRELIQKLQLEQAIVLSGYVPAEDIPALMNGATAFVFPSAYEGFGFPVLEAQACGTPVVASSAASLPEVGGDGALYADPASPDSIAEQILRILDDSKLRHELRQRGFANLKRFSWEKCAQQTLNALEMAVS